MIVPWYSVYAAQWTWYGACTVVEVRVNRELQQSVCDLRHPGQRRHGLTVPALSQLTWPSGLFAGLRSKHMRMWASILRHQAVLGRECRRARQLLMS